MDWRFLYLARQKAVKTPTFQKGFADSKSISYAMINWLKAKSEKQSYASYTSKGATVPARVPSAWVVVALWDGFPLYITRFHISMANPWHCRQPDCGMKSLEAPSDLTISLVDAFWMVSWYLSSIILHNIKNNQNIGHAVMRIKIIYSVYILQMPLVSQTNTFCLEGYHLTLEHAQKTDCWHMYRRYVYGVCVCVCVCVLICMRPPLSLWALKAGKLQV